MKVAIISINMYSKGLNFACPLHTYAFQEFLLKNGVDATVLNYKPNYFNNFDLRHPYDYYVPLVEQCAQRMESQTGKQLKNSQKELKRLINRRNGYQEAYREREIRYDKFQHFIDTRYRKTEICYDSDLLEVLDPGFDCYICATDVIWGYTPNRGFDRGFFLASRAMENKWKIAYSASCGVYVPQKKKESAEFFRYIEDIDYLSVREESLKDYIEENTNREVSLVLDPVLLHDDSFYEEFVEKPAEAKEGYIFLYYVMEHAEDTIANAIRYAKAHDLLVVEAGDFPRVTGKVKDSDGVRHIFRYDIGIEEWLGYIRYAEAVFTNSFHAACFSLLFEKDLYAGKRNSNKLAHILHMFGLDNRQISSGSDVVNAPPPPIDYERVREVLKRRRQESADFVLSALKDIENRERPPRDYESRKREIRYPVIYNSGAGGAVAATRLGRVSQNVTYLDSGSIEVAALNPFRNAGESIMGACCFRRDGFRMVGWNFRIKIDNLYFWYTEDGALVRDRKTERPNKKVFLPGEPVPYLPVNRISRAVAEGVWTEAGRYPICYRSGKQDPVLRGLWGPSARGTQPPKRLLVEVQFNLWGMPPSSVSQLEDGSVELRPSGLIQNDGAALLASRCFNLEGFWLTGWNLRAQIGGEWFWLTLDGGLAPCGEEDCPEKKLFPPGAHIPYIPADQVDMVIAEGVWEERPSFCYNSGRKNLARSPVHVSFDMKPRASATVNQLRGKAIEVCPDKVVRNDGTFKLGEYCFSAKGYRMKGWNLRVKTDDGWFWYANDGVLVSRTDAKPQNKKVFLAGETLPYIPADRVHALVAVGVWQGTFLVRLRGKLRRIKRRLTRKFLKRSATKKKK